MSVKKYAQRLKALKLCFFLSQPLERTDNMLTMIAQIVIAKHNERVGKPLIDHACQKDGSANPSNKIMVFLPDLAQMHQPVKSLGARLMSVGHGDSSP